MSNQNDFKAFATGGNANLPTQISINGGYQELPSGLIIQWGIHRFKPLVENKVNLPIPFKKVILNIQIVDTEGLVVPMAAAVYPDGTLDSFRAWCAGRSFSYDGKEYQILESTPINGQYLVIGY
ncbi:hypothetical protein Xsto_01237 [Xenorhabdus stockiae]|uniref:Putative tail fiber protein gp53-like C-terminal domain-containing protein n=1 Tax=Xenorhabdus stockiae TaxID=351614 RepID=A0A2D0KSK1_9GAMM|nr:hypothetical protein [Xenorhabdus stockiae]PHM66305.1 hypothetical protein Xsto_01237 [Xenorhabdus stockiae]